MEDGKFYTRAPNGCAGEIWTSHMGEVIGSEIRIYGRLTYNRCEQDLHMTDFWLAF